MSTKNETRLASLMGTWTAEATVKSNFDLYELNVNMVLYLTGDPLRENACEIPGGSCDEVDNRMCILGPRGGEEGRRCADMATEVSDWSDVVAFIYLGVSFKLGMPFFIHETYDTGGWIGPMSMVIAQNFTGNGTTTATPRLQLDVGEQKLTLAAKGGAGVGGNEDGARAPSTMEVVDRYETRYVQTPITPYIRFHPNCTLMDYEDFETYFGSEAVKNTARAQGMAGNHSSGRGGDGDDPYEPYYGTCDNGNLKPILPMAEFEFVRNNDNDTTEDINVRLDYRLLTIPDGNLAHWMPTVQKRFIHALKGPYCYGNDLRGWVIDLPYDSKKGNKFVHVLHDCVEGLPCTPPAAQLFATTTKVEIRDRPGATTIDVRGIFVTSTVIAILGIFLLVTVVSNYRLRKRYRRKVREYEGVFHPLASEGGQDDDEVARHRLEMEVHTIQEEAVASSQEGLSTPLVQSKAPLDAPGHRRTKSREVSV